MVTIRMANGLVRRGTMWGSGTASSKITSSPLQPELVVRTIHSKDGMVTRTSGEGLSTTGFEHEHGGTGGDACEHATDRGVSAGKAGGPPVPLSTARRSIALHRRADR